jgi:L-galactose dehydrogenase
MHYRVLGRTNWNASVIGLGCGGPSRLGMRGGGSEDAAADVVRAALDLGINFLDTAEAYGTEGAVGKALAGRDRGAVFVSTKIPATDKDVPVTADALTARLDACLARLGTDYVDVLHLHGVSLAEYPHAVGTLAPALARLRDAGKVRFLGLTEAFGPDPSHEMLKVAVRDDCWDVMMVGFNLLNQSARDTVFPTTREKEIGVLGMFAVRRALSRPDQLKATVGELIAGGHVRAEDFDPDAPLDFLLGAGGATSIPDAAYRFCRDEPGMGVVLSGTGNVAHLKENVASLLAPPLPPTTTERLRRLFAGVDCVSGN